MTTTRLANIEVEDTAVAILRFRNGALGSIEATTATRPKDLEGSLSILGERGSVVVKGFAMDQLATWEFAWNHTLYLQDVVETIQSGKRALVDGLEGRKSLELINAMYESAETGREVALRFRPKLCKLGIRENGRL